MGYRDGRLTTIARFVTNATRREPRCQDRPLLHAQSAGWIDARGAQRRDQRRCGGSRDDDGSAHQIGPDAELRDDLNGTTEDLPQPGGYRQTHADAQRCRLQRLAQDSRDNLTDRRTEREADPKLARTL